MKAIKEYNEQQMLLAKEEQRWFQSLADQHNNSKYSKSKWNPEETNATAECQTHPDGSCERATSAVSDNNATNTTIEESKKRMEPMDALD